MLGYAAATGLAACARARTDRPLSLWALSWEGDYSPLLMPAFTRATGLAVEVQSVPATEAHEKLLTAHAGDALPDVLMLPSGWVAEFAMIGAVAPVADVRLLADMFPGVVGAVGYRGHAYAVPWSVAPQMQFYRRDILAAAGYDAPPPDWSDWRTMARTIKRRRPDAFAVLLYLNWPDALFTFAAQTGARFLRDRDTRGAFAEPAFAQALEFYVSLFREGLAPRALSTEIQDPFAAFAQGYFAIYPEMPTLLRDLTRRAGELPRTRWGVARMPGPEGPGKVFGTTGSLAISRRTARPVEAWALVRHLTSIPSELRLQSLIGNLPARRKAWQAPQLADPTMVPFAAQLQDTARYPNIVEWERIRAEVQLVAERVVRGGLGIAEGCVEMDRRVDAILAKRRDLVESGRIA